MKNTKKTALSALLAALSVVIMYAGSLLGNIDIATAVISSVCVMISLAEFGYRRAIAVYAITVILGAVLLPAKTAAVLFGGFLGYYPILKTYLEERFPKITAYIIKYAVMNVSLGIMVTVTVIFFVKIAVWVIAVAFAVCNVSLVVYDYAMSSLLEIYYTRLRKKLM